ncbi:MULTISPECIES: LysR family transcriptional regulator [Brucella/Ochrobactrum group]|uniref:LysR family transcriptional regulator n=1 Tax=Ochrobactrum soli TaxID=2448455 RepID=A0A849KL57_9HYPH|nr:MULTISPECIES: LysR family transcriptional regulator [Brucella]MCI1002040.1 LysR family transcriptional regulator [Ochrobactrum sp. C6C9]RRD23071.1 LysR family transcriptional regulator [Brucellaceae bacterium VT-16-1752]WHT44713.1 LysR family transcriptional regulator [Ochrobactrum sp. SSR]NNU61113.1 LysR family transcriptional regulator [[Ochrobactrum] soli]RLL64190.1 LysR family transcriptional regulator [[Ochrobactrum] soli]
MRPTLRQIECFQAVVELGNFSRAAERVRTTQANLSHTIRDLEAVLDARLFDRTTRRVSLTDAGRAFAEGALAGLAEIDRAAETVRDLGKLRRGQVSIAAPPLLCTTVLPRLVRRVADEYPNLVIKIDDVGPETVIKQVRNGRCDLGIGTFSGEDSDVESQTALRDQLMVFVSPEHDFAGYKQVGWSELDNQPIITLTQKSNIRLLTELGFEQAKLALRPHIEVNQIHTVLSLVEVNAGIAVLPAYAFTALRGRGIVARPLTDPAVVREVRLIAPRDREQSAATIAVRAILRNLLRQMIPEIPGPDSKTKKI